MSKDLLLTLSPDQRRRALKRELINSLTFIVEPEITEEHLFTAFFGDPSGHNYWESWLTNEREDLGSFVALLAAHNAKSNKQGRSREELHYAYINRSFERPIYRALIDAAKRKVDWLHGDTTPLSNGAFEKCDYFRPLLGNIEVERRAMTEWLLEDPNYRCLIPELANRSLKITKSLPLDEIRTKKKGRGPGTGFCAVDRKLFPKIHKLIESGEAQSAHGAALIIVKSIPGNGTEPNRARRVADRYNAEWKPRPSGV